MTRPLNRLPAQLGVPLHAHAHETRTNIHTIRRMAWNTGSGGATYEMAVCRQGQGEATASGWRQNGRRGGERRGKDRPGHDPLLLQTT